MPTLDFANPLYTLSSTNLTFTTTKECYLFIGDAGAVGVNGKLKLTIDGTIIIDATNNSGGIFYSQVFTGYLKLKAGTTLVLSGNIPPELHFYILDVSD